MNIIGLNLDKTQYGLPLDNGGACLIVDGNLVSMINEERLTRHQYTAGYSASLRYVLNVSNLQIDDIDLFVVSSCLEPLVSPLMAQKNLRSHGFDVPVSKIKVCGHHLSHAYSTFYPSNFEQALVLVADGDGNVIDPLMAPGTDNSNTYWNNLLEHTSYYIADHKKGIAFLERDHVPAGENGLGGAYRYFTYFCGFPGYKFAGKLMGLSAYGHARKTLSRVKLFDILSNGQVTCHLPDANRLDSPNIVERWLRDQGVATKARLPHEPITAAIEDAAYLIQQELNNVMVEKVKHLVAKTGIKNLCIAGGVGLNAVTNREILDKAGIENIFIQPASGDSGQPLGNALYGLVTQDPHHQHNFKFSVYQGKVYTDKEIEKAFQMHADKINIEKMTPTALIKLAAQKVAANHIIAWFQGRSEIGPRALGNRSLIANPINGEMKQIINDRVKHREAFRPFAPSVLEEKAGDWFDITIPAPYMILNAKVKQPDRIPSVTHVDGSARIQTVNQEANSKYYRLIFEFEKITGVPVVINTSFNDNEAIVETPADALATFLRTNIDYLFINNYYVSKK